MIAIFQIFSCNFGKRNRQIFITNQASEVETYQSNLHLFLLPLESKFHFFCIAEFRKDECLWSFGKTEVNRIHSFPLVCNNWRTLLDWSTFFLGHFSFIWHFLSVLSFFMTFKTFVWIIFNPNFNFYRNWVALWIKYLLVDWFEWDCIEKQFLFEVHLQPKIWSFDDARVEKAFTTVLLQYRWNTVRKLWLPIFKISVALKHGWHSLFVRELAWLILNLTCKLCEV